MHTYIVFLCPAYKKPGRLGITEVMMQHIALEW